MILIHLARGFEETEAITVIDVLRRADLDAHFVSLGVFRQVIGAHGIMIEADYRYEEVDYGCCDMIVLPGGLEGAKALSVHKGVRKQLLTFAREGKGLAAICAAPMILGELGILEGKRATIYPGMEEQSHRSRTYRRRCSKRYKYNHIAGTGDSYGVRPVHSRVF